MKVPEEDKVSGRDSCAKLSPYSPWGPGPTCIPHMSLVSWGLLALQPLHCSFWRQRSWSPVFPADLSCVYVNKGHARPAGSSSCIQSSSADLTGGQEGPGRASPGGEPGRGQGEVGLPHFPLIPQLPGEGSLINSRWTGPLHPHLPPAAHKQRGQP